MTMSLSPDELQRLLDENSQRPGIIAHLDQQQAALDMNRNVGIWWAGVLLLCAERENESAKLMALHHMRLFLGSRSEEELLAMVAFLLTDTMMRIAEYEHDRDLPAAVARIAGNQMLFFEKFVATGGASCPACGADEGWGDHDCDDTEHVEE